MISSPLPPTSRLETLELTIELFDEEAQEYVSIEDASSITVMIVDECGSRDKALLTATLNNGITMPETGIIVVSFTDTQMKTLEPGSYVISGTITKDDQTVQFMNATLPVIGPDV
jgi:hypothetical protein